MFISVCFSTYPHILSPLILITALWDTTTPFCEHENRNTQALSTFSRLVVNEMQSNLNISLKKGGLEVKGEKSIIMESRKIVVNLKISLANTSANTVE